MSVFINWLICSDVNKAKDLTFRSKDFTFKPHQWLAWQGNNIGAYAFYIGLFQYCELFVIYRLIKCFRKLWNHYWCTQFEFELLTSYTTHLLSNFSSSFTVSFNCAKSLGVTFRLSWLLSWRILLSRVWSRSVTTFSWQNTLFHAL